MTHKLSPCVCGRKAEMFVATLGARYVACSGYFLAKCWMGPYGKTSRAAARAWNRVMRKVRGKK